MVRRYNPLGLNPPPESYPSEWQDAVETGVPVLGTMAKLPWGQESARKRFRLFIKTLLGSTLHPWHNRVRARIWHWRVSEDGRHYLIHGTPASREEIERRDRIMFPEREQKGEDLRKTIDTTRAHG